MIRLDQELRLRMAGTPRRREVPEELRRHLRRDILRSGGRAGFNLERLLETLTDGPPTT
jgi:hypothetical protein